MMALVENINTAVELEETKLIEASLQVLLGMQLNLPEHTALRENLSKTKLIDNLIQVVGYKPANRGFGVDIRRKRRIHSINNANSVNLTSDAIQLISHLLSNQGPGTSTIHHAHGVLDSLCDKLSNDREHQAYIVELKLDDESSSGLMTLAAVPLIVKMMHSTRTPDCQQWGCSALKYILRQDDTSVTQQQVVQAFRSDVAPSTPAFGTPAHTAAVNLVVDAMKTHKTHAGLNREAIGFLHLLKEKDTAVKGTLVDLGLVQILGDTMQKTHTRFPPDVSTAAETLLMLVLS